MFASRPGQRALPGVAGQRESALRNVIFGSHAGPFGVGVGRGDVDRW
jgi:hypothetical protein